MKKPLLMVAATGLFLFYNDGLSQWIQSGHNPGDVWRAATPDWFLAVTLSDMSFFSLPCLLWLYRNMQRRGFSGGKKLLLLVATLITGVVALLLYLAFRPAKKLS